MLHAHAAKARVAFHAFVLVDRGSVLFRVDVNGSHGANGNTVSARHAFGFADQHAVTSGKRWDCPPGLFSTRRRQKANMKWPPALPTEGKYEVYFAFHRPNRLYTDWRTRSARGSWVLRPQRESLRRRAISSPMPRRSSHSRTRIKPPSEVTRNPWKVTRKNLLKGELERLVFGLTHQVSTSCVLRRCLLHA